MPMKTTNRVLELLYDRGDGYFLLDELASACSLPLRELEHAVDQLKARGHQFELSPALGIRLARPVRLDGWLIERRLGEQRIGRGVICFDEVDSTNDIAFDSAAQDDTDGLVVLAE